jgi:hypothetical protein
LFFCWFFFCFFVVFCCFFVFFVLGESKFISYTYNSQRGQHACPHSNRDPAEERERELYIIIYNINYATGRSPHFPSSGGYAANELKLIE